MSQPLLSNLNKFEADKAPKKRKPLSGNSTASKAVTLFKRTIERTLAERPHIVKM